MKKGFTTETAIHNKMNYILVSNFPDENEILNFGVIDFNFYQKEYYVGMWKIKRK